MRNKIFDTLRGFAIVFMVMANTAPIFHGEFPLILRICFSLAAPAFVLVSGLMVAIISSKHDISYFVKKAIFIIAIAASVDVFINQLVPFQGFDVLYLIGFSLPLVAWCLKLNNRYIYLSVLLIFVVAELLRSYIGYMKDPDMNDMNIANFISLIEGGPSIKNWFIDGWFPFFPWTGIMLFGGLIGKSYVESNNPKFFESKKFLSKLGAIFSVACVAFFTSSFPEMYLRHGYAEIFYPPHLSVICFAVSFVMMMLAMSEYIQRIECVNNFFGILGRSSMMLYVIHLIVISFVIKPLVGEIFALELYLGIFVLHITLIYFVACFLTFIRSKYKNIPVILSWLIGK